MTYFQTELSDFEVQARKMGNAYMEANDGSVSSTELRVLSIFVIEAWSAGLSYTQIAEKVGAQSDANQIAGAIDRLKAGGFLRALRRHSKTFYEINYK